MTLDKQLETFYEEVQGSTGTKLETRTDAYINRAGEFNEEGLKLTDKYIQKLLPLELAFAKWRTKRGETCLPDPQKTQVDCLVLLLGFSFEPLLQSIVIYQPKAILLVVSEEVRNEALDSAFEAAVKKLAETSYDDSTDSVCRGKLIKQVPVFIDVDQLKDQEVEKTVPDIPLASFDGYSTSSRGTALGSANS